jgi:hypothetical protein
MGFREALPANCPPLGAHDGSCEKAYRFIPSAIPAAADFASYAANGEPPPEGVDPCRWASCSLYADLSTVHKKRKLKNLRNYSFVAQMKIEAGSGMLLQRSSHIDFWMYDTFNPTAAVVDVIGLQDDEGAATT